MRCESESECELDLLCGLFLERVETGVLLKANDSDTRSSVNRAL